MTENDQTSRFIDNCVKCLSDDSIITVVTIKVVENVPINSTICYKSNIYTRLYQNLNWLTRFYINI